MNMRLAAVLVAGVGGPLVLAACTVVLAPHPSEQDIRDAMANYRPFVDYLEEGLIKDGTAQPVDYEIAHLIVQYDPAACKGYSSPSLRCQVSWRRDCSKTNVCEAHASFQTEEFRFVKNRDAWAIESWAMPYHESDNS